MYKLYISIYVLCDFVQIVNTEYLYYKIHVLSIYICSVYISLCLHCLLYSYTEGGDRFTKCKYFPDILEPMDTKYDNTMFLYIIRFGLLFLNIPSSNANLVYSL